MVGNLMPYKLSPPDTLGYYSFFMANLEFCSVRNSFGLFSPFFCRVACPGDPSSRAACHVSVVIVVSVITAAEALVGNTPWYPW